MAIKGIWNRISGYFRSNEYTLLSQIGLSERVFNLLHNRRDERRSPGLGLSTVEELMGYSGRNLLRLDRFGPSSLLELVDKLDEHGFTEFGVANRVLLAQIKRKRHEDTLKKRVRASAPVYDRYVPAPYRMGEEPTAMRHRIGTVMHHREIPVMLKRKQAGE